MTANRLKDYTDQGVASVVTGFEMPDTSLRSDRTEVIRVLAASNMLKHLLSDDWNPSSHEIMREFIFRLAANAERQGILIGLQSRVTDPPL